MFIGQGMIGKILLSIILCVMILHNQSRSSDIQEEEITADEMELNITSLSLGEEDEEYRLSIQFKVTNRSKNRLAVFFGPDTKRRIGFSFNFFARTDEGWIPIVFFMLIDNDWKTSVVLNPNESITQSVILVFSEEIDNINEAEYVKSGSQIKMILYGDLRWPGYWKGEVESESASINDFSDS